MRRTDWWDGTEYDEVLSLEPGAVRLDRLNLGAPYLDSHNSYGLENVIGSVVPGSAKIAEGIGTCRILLSRAAGDADTVQKIKDGVIRNNSVGYWLHKIVKTQGDDGSVARWDVVDWEPLEISAVPIPADPGSQIRSRRSDQAKGPPLRACIVETRTSAAAPTATRKDKRMKTKGKAAKRDATAEAEAEKKRLAALRAAQRADDSASDTAEEDEDEDESRTADEDGEEAGDGRDGDAGDDGDDDRDDDADSDEDPDKDGDKGRAPSAAAVQRAAAAAVRAERVRIAKITEMAERASLPKLGKRHLGLDTSAERFGEIVLERLLERQAKRGNPTVSAAAGREVGDAPRNGAADQQSRFDKGASEARALLGKKA